MDKRSYLEKEIAGRLLQSSSSGRRKGLGIDDKNGQNYILKICFLNISEIKQLTSIYFLIYGKGLS